MGVEGIGASVVRKEDRRFITGKGRYVDDIKLLGMTHAHFVRSPHAHARISGIDASKAEALKGVKAVITAADLPDLTNGNSDLHDILDNCMARKKALYDGHAVAAVAAIDARNR